MQVIEYCRYRIAAIAGDCKSLALRGFVGSSPTTCTKLVERALVVSELTDARQSKGDGRYQYIILPRRCNSLEGRLGSDRGEWFESLPREH